MENLDIRTVIPILRQFGISPEQLGPEKLEELMKIADLINNPVDITPEVSRKILDAMGVGPRAPIAPKKIISDKIGRNSLCSCASGKKFKKCCGVTKD